MAKIHDLGNDIGLTQLDMFQGSHINAACILWLAVFGYGGRGVGWNGQQLLTQQGLGV